MPIVENPRHGSPQDRGSADRYYGRPFDPHYYIGNSYTGSAVSEENMTDAEIREYTYGWDNENDRKDWE